METIIQLYYTQYNVICINYKTKSMTIIGKPDFGFDICTNLMKRDVLIIIFFLSLWLHHHHHNHLMEIMITFSTSSSSLLLADQPIHPWDNCCCKYGKQVVLHQLYYDFFIGPFTESSDFVSFLESQDRRLRSGLMAAETDAMWEPTVIFRRMFVLCLFLKPCNQLSSCTWLQQNYWRWSHSAISVT